jgi:soluble lytic murein transglycosylase-like protein
MATAHAWKPEILSALHSAAGAAGLDRAFVRAVCFVESRGNPGAISSVGARGLMQLMPSTAQALGVVDAFDPVQNAAGGARYLAALIRQFGDERMALCAYNWGPGNLTNALKHSTDIPGQVLNYATKVLERAAVERRGDPLSRPAAPPPGLACFACPGCGLELHVVGGGEV